MSEVYAFLKECGAFFVLSMNGDFPAGRPFGAVIEENGALYISTGDMKSVYKQLTTYPNIQLVALRPGTRSWIRVTGKAVESADRKIKERLLAECPSLLRHFPTADAPHFAVFRVDVLETEMY